VAMVRMKVRKRILFIMCLSLLVLNLIDLILAERLFRHNLHWSQLRVPEVEDGLRLWS
jgi:hypothetical protein